MQRFSGSLPFSISFLPASLYIISIYNNQKIITRENLSKIDRNATEKSNCNSMYLFEYILLKIKTTIK